MTDQKQYRKEATDRVAESCLGKSGPLLLDLARVVVDYYVQPHFQPIDKVDLKAGSLVDVRLDDGYYLGSGTWVKAEITPIDAEGVAESHRTEYARAHIGCIRVYYGIYGRGIICPGIIPIHASRIQPRGWFTDKTDRTRAFDVNQSVWVWHRATRQWAIAHVLSDRDVAGLQWTAETYSSLCSHTHVYCAGEIIAQSQCPHKPAHPLQPEDGACEPIKPTYKRYSMKGYGCGFDDRTEN